MGSGLDSWVECGKCRVARRVMSQEWKLDGEQSGEWEHMWKMESGVLSGEWTGVWSGTENAQ